MHEHDPRARLGSSWAFRQRFAFFASQFWAQENPLRLIDAVGPLRAGLLDFRLMLASSKKSGYVAVDAR